MHTELWPKCMQIVVHGMSVLFDIISLAFKWLIVLRSAIRTCDQMHRVLKNMFAVF